MNYLLIIFILMLILAPIVWIKPSRHQQKIAQLRKLASQHGFRVQLCCAPDAREGQGRLEFVKYQLPWTQGHAAESWLIVKGSRRGDPSNWEDWSWLSRAPEDSLEKLGDCLEKLSEDVRGLQADNQGLAFYWQEKDGVEDFYTNENALNKLYNLMNKNI